MKERPILFSAPMVQAILDGRKTQTRRVVKPQPHIDSMGNFCVGDLNYGQDNGPCTRNFAKWKCPYGQVGDRLWVRENTQADHSHDMVTLSKYAADGVPVLYLHTSDPEYDGSVAHWQYPREVRPSIHMPRWASRIDLLIKAVRVERLNDISEEDARAEGIKTISHGREGNYYHHTRDGISPDNFCFPDGAFKDLWTRINGPESWAANPWVWVVEFERVKP